MHDDGRTERELADELGRLRQRLAEAERQRDQAEAARRESDQRFYNIFNGGPHGIVIVDLDGRFQSVNQAFCRMLGYTPEELLGKSFAEVTHPAFVERDQDLTRRLYAGEFPYFKVDKQYLRKDGGVCDGCVTATVIRDPAGRPLQFLSMIEDLTQRKRSEQEIARQCDLAQQYLDIAAVLMLALDSEGRVTLINQNGCRLLEYSPEEVQGRNWFELCVPEPARERVESVFRQLMAGQPVPGDSFENELVSKSGARHLISFRNTVIRDASGRIVGTLSSGEDITERRAAELERANLEEQLRQSQKMEAIGRLAGGVAHDFNNLLTGIIGNVSLALVDLEPEHPLQALLGEVNQAADSAARLTRQLLAFSRKQLLEPRVIDVNELIRNMHNMLSRLIGEDIELRIAAGTVPACVKADPGQLEQVLFNLCVNARDAMPDGGKLAIETTCVSQAASHGQPDQVRLSISDTGCGMTEDVKTRCFEPFFTTKSSEIGTGLGLATVYGVAQQAGGSIEVFSEPGKGTTFNLYLPRVLESVHRSLHPGFLPVIPGGTETILLVEDEPMVRNLALRVLGRLGYRVLDSPNANEALRTAKTHGSDIHLLMTDIVLPGTNGRVLAEQLQALQPQMKVLFTSGYAEDVVVNHGVLRSGIQFLAKPYTVQTLAHKIREVLEET